MADITPEELRKHNDPWVDWFLDEQERLLGDMTTQNLCHMAESFGRPGSMTESGRKYKALSYEFEAHSLRLMLYALHKGYITMDQLNFSNYEKKPPKVKSHA